MDPWPSDLILTCELWVSQNKLASLIGTRAECEAANGPRKSSFFWRTAELASQREVGRPTCWLPYIHHFMEMPLDLSLLSTQRGRANQCPWSEELTDGALSVASPTCNVLIAVINSPRQHLEAVWAINERVRQWRSVLFCCGRNHRASGGFGACARDSDPRSVWVMQPQEMLFSQAVTRVRHWWGGGGGCPVLVTSGEVIIPQCIRMLSMEKLQQGFNREPK